MFQIINPFIIVRDTNLVTSAPGDGLAPKGARPSAGTLLNTKLDMISLTHWGRVTHICVSKLTIIGSDNGLSPRRRQAIIWTNAGILLIGPLGTKFSEILIEILRFSIKTMRLKGSSAKWRPFCLGLNVLKASLANDDYHFTFAGWMTPFKLLPSHSTSWVNFSGTEARISQANYINTMDADALAPCFPRSSTSMVLNICR